MPLLKQALDGLPPLEGMRLACSMHLDIKMAPFVEGVLGKGAKVFLTTCNAHTVRDEVVSYLIERGASARAQNGMDHAALLTSYRSALEWEPTHLCEMGADLSHTLLSENQDGTTIRAGLEATGSGITRMEKLRLPYPVYNWDDLPVKEGLHNRHMVGLTCWHAFFQRTGLTLHGKRVLVVGYGSVGRGVAAAARAYGGAVTVAERDPARSLEAQFAGWSTAGLNEAIPQADVVVTATGASGILGDSQFRTCKDGAFLLNVGHNDSEIDLNALREWPVQQPVPYVEEFDVEGKRLYLFSGGSMANLTAGRGDSINAFDITLAILTAGIGFIAEKGVHAPAGLHPLPDAVWKPVLQ